MFEIPGEDSGSNLVEGGVSSKTADKDEENSGNIFTKNLTPSTGHKEKVIGLIGGFLFLGLPWHIFDLDVRLIILLSVVLVSIVYALVERNFWIIPSTFAYAFIGVVAGLFFQYLLVIIGVYG